MPEPDKSWEIPRVADFERLHGALAERDEARAEAERLRAVLAEDGADLADQIARAVEARENANAATLRAEAEIERLRRRLASVALVARDVLAGEYDGPDAWQEVETLALDRAAPAGSRDELTGKDGST